jgi:hypothetical protein
VATREPISVGARLQSIGRDVAGWGRALAVVVAVLYAAGFLVVNAYLGTFGVRDLEPLRTRYIATGTSFLLLATVAAIAAARMLDVVLAFTSRRRSKSIRLLLNGIGLPIVVGVVTLLLFFVVLQLNTSTLVGPLRSEATFRDLAWFAFAVLIAVLISRNRRTDWHTTYGGMIILGSLTSLVGGLISYTNTIYPALPSWFGGGRPDDVVLVMDEPTTVCPLCGAGPVKLIDDDGSRLIVLVDTPDGKQRAVEIARSEVRSITHSPITPRR